MSLTPLAAAAQLHLPDLPELEVGLAAGASGPRQQRRWRWREAFGSYLPLMLMALLAAATGWLVKHTPLPGDTAVRSAPRPGPDYSMSEFSITRFDPQGQYQVRIEGRLLRHFPDTDQVEIDGVRMHAISPQGRVTDARAQRAVANADASEVQLFGAAQVRSEQPGSPSLEVDGAHLHIYLRSERLLSDQPVALRRGDSLIQASGISLDNRAQTLTLAGPLKAQWLAAGSGPVQRLQDMKKPAGR